MKRKGGEGEFKVKNVFKERKNEGKCFYQVGMLDIWIEDYAIIEIYDEKNCVKKLTS